MERDQGVRTSSVLKTLLDRELGSRRRPIATNHGLLVPSIERRLDSTFNDISKCVKALSNAIDSAVWTDIQHAIRMLFSKMLEMSPPDQVNSVNFKRKQEREVFVALGGMHLLLRLFEKPFCEPDARSMSLSLVHSYSELWNEVLVILREVCYTIPTLSEQLFGNDHIIFFFTLLVHRSVFENSISMLEEILAVRIETFSLALVPKLFSLVSKFSARHLAHFCRVLSLVLFEPEDRQILEGSQVLRSLELLQLRRDRVVKSSNIVERNQCLIIDMPDLLNRFLTLLRVANYGPNLADLARHNINSQDSPGNAGLFQFISTSRNTAGLSEWDHLLSLDSIVKKAEAAGELRNPNRNANKDSASPSISGRNSSTSEDVSPLRSFGVPDGENRHISSDLSLDETMAELLAAFAPGEDVDGQRPMDLSALLNVVQIAQSLGLTAVAPDGEPIPLPDGDPYSSNSYNTANSRGANRTGPGPAGYRRGASCAASPPPPSPTAAKKELQFHAMFLNPHHVELLFVLCTLLSGRRKINVQHKLASLGLADILLDMYGRMSWESKPFHGHNPMEHIHGPGCDCNPESALRVQYLRLVHNSYDRDFQENTNKMMLLSAAEKEVLRRCRSPEEVTSQGFFISSSDRGIFTRIVNTLLKEPVESVYRFWLSSCLESFLRGSGPDEQVFIAISGILSYTVTHIVDMGIRPSASANLQTAFDLLGELVKGNQHTIEMVDSALGDTNFTRFMDAVMSNLVDSNVFVRSLYLSIDAFSDSDPHEQHQQPATTRERDSSRSGAGGYLSHSWVQYAPQPVSQYAIELVRNRGSSSNTCTERKSKAPSSSSSCVCTAGKSGRTTQQSSSFDGDASSSSSPTPSSSSRLTHSVRGALQNIREAASHFLTFTSPPAPSYPNTVSQYGGGENAAMRCELQRGQSEFVRSNSQQSLHACLQTRVDPEGDVEVDYEEFFTPPEAPHFARHRNGNSSSKAESSKKTSNSHSSSRGSLKKSAYILPQDITSADLGPNAELTHLPVSFRSVASSTAASSCWDDDFSNNSRPSVDGSVPDSRARGQETDTKTKRLPDSLQRFHFFLVQQREYILFRLMITVTMYTINHENICCLNTALLILLLADKRGQLSQLLQNVRQLAEVHATQSEPALHPLSSQSPSNNDLSQSHNEMTEGLYTLSSTGSGANGRRDDVSSAMSDEHATAAVATKANGSKRGSVRGRSRGSVVERMRSVGEEGDVAEYCATCGEGDVSLQSSYPLREEKEKERGGVRCSTSSHQIFTASSSSSRDRDRRSDKGCIHCDTCSISTTPSRIEPELEVEDSSSSDGHEDRSENTGIRHKVAGKLSGFYSADRVMVNFRELLWYWREYYLRRGRDRLSIEFSSHIPFIKWNALVDVLCRDDGSPTALLPAPIPLPRSPYHRPPRAQNCSSPDIVQYVP